MAKIDTLIEGYKEFYDKYFVSGDDDLYKGLSTGQSPKTLIISCSDSRVDPAIITNAKAGDIFVVRNVANIVPPYEKEEGKNAKTSHGVSAALEFAVRFLEVEHIVILGHSKCAGIRSLVNSDPVKHTDFIEHWVTTAKKAKEIVIKNNEGNDLSEDELSHQCEKESVVLSLKNLLQFPWIKSRIDENKLQIHGWHLDIETGKLVQYNKNSGVFEGV